AHLQVALAQQVEERPAAAGPAAIACGLHVGGPVHPPRRADEGHAGRVPARQRRRALHARRRTRLPPSEGLGSCASTSRSCARRSTTASTALTGPASARARSSARSCASTWLRVFRR